MPAKARRLRGLAAALAGRAPATTRRRGALRRPVGPAAATRRRPGSSTSRARSEAVTHELREGALRGAGRGRPATWSRWRPTWPPGCPRWSSPGCRTPPCTRPGTGSAPPIVNSGQQLAEPADHRQPAPGRRCPSTARPSTWPSPRRCSAAPGELPLAAAGRGGDPRRAGAGRHGPAGARRAADGRRRGPRRHRPGRRAGRQRRRGGGGPRRPGARGRTPCTGWSRFVRDGAPLLDPPAAGPPPAARRARTWPTSPGRRLGRRALEVAAAGGHHLALLGPPGRRQDHAGRAAAVDPAGARTTRRRWRSPRCTRSPALLPPGGRLLRRPPFQAPHHTATVPALVGGGSGLARPGRGVAGPPRRALPRRGARVQQRARWRRCASRWSSGRIRLTRGPGRHRVPGPGAAGAGRQPLPVREAGRRRALRVQPAGPAPLPGPALRAAARPDRRAGRRCCRCGRPS